MNKLGAVLIIIGLLVAVNLFLLAGMPVIREMVSTANETITASSNLSNYPGTQETLVATPWILYFVPNCIGIAVIVVILKRP